MSKESYIRTLLNESLLKEENIKWCDTASDLDDMAYVVFVNYTSSDEFKNILASDIGEPPSKMLFSYPTQYDFIVIYNDKQNPGIEKIYNFSKEYLRKIKLMTLNEIE